MTLLGNKRREVKSRKGYIAFVSFLVISAVIFVIGITLALLGVSEAQMGFAEEKGGYAYALAEGCAEDALLSIFYNGSYGGGTKTFPEGTCTISTSKTGGTWTVIAEATSSGHTRKIQVKMVREKDIKVTDWKEIE